MNIINREDLIEFYVNRMGWNLLPIPKNEKAYYGKWKGYQKKFFPIERLKRHDGNFAIVQGEISGNFIKLDFDIHFNNEYSTHQLYKIILMKCPELKDCIAIKSQSGGVHIGVHLTSMSIYHELSRKLGIWCNIDGIKEIDIKGEGGLAIIPPSMINGNSYQYLNVKSFEELGSREFPRFSKKQFEAIYNKLCCLDFQTEVLKKLRHKAHRAIARGEIEIKKYAQSSKKHDEFNYWYAFELDCIFAELKDEEIHFLLKRAQRAYKENKVQSDLNYLRNDERNPYKIATLNQMYPEVEYQTLSSSSSFNVFNEKAQLLYYEETGKKCTYGKDDKFFTKDFTRWIENKKNQEEEIELDPHTIAKEILKEEYIYCPLEWHRTILRYVDGCWREYPMDVLEHIILDYFLKIEYHKETDTNILKKLNTVKRYIKKEAACSIHDFDSNDFLINLKNGIMDITDLDNPRICPHDPQYKIRRQLPIFYDEHAKCYEVNAFMKGIFHKEDIELIKQKIGLCYTTLMSFQKGTILYGEGNNGKTTFYNMLTEHLSKKNVSHVDPTDFNDGFLVSQMEGKIANICSEVNTQDELNITTLKLHIGGENTFLVNKKYEKPYEGTPTAKHWYGCNDDFMNIPPNASKGFFRKFDLIECPNMFDGKEDRMLLDRITTEKEFSGLFNDCLTSLIKLLKDKDFANDCVALTEWEDVKDFWIERRNPFQLFVKECCETGSYEEATKNPNCEFWEQKDAVLLAYNDWRKNNGKPPLSSVGKLTGIIKSSGYLHTRRKVGTRQEAIYGGFKLKKKVIENLELITKKEEKEQKIDEF
ncbi:MAG: hypothetical protein EU548_03560 [Promethearchaeota archaeon]|nr:MAG: hypothetical protein EU548_03560 [Candidatus Lokiarchaeota archaeon]